MRAYLVFFSWGGVILVKCGWFAGLGIIWSVSKGLISLFRLEKQNKQGKPQKQRIRNAEKQRSKETWKSRKAKNQETQ